MKIIIQIQFESIYFNRDPKAELLILVFGFAFFCLNFLSCFKGGMKRVNPK